MGWGRSHESDSQVHCGDSRPKVGVDVVIRAIDVGLGSSVDPFQGENAASGIRVGGVMGAAFDVEHRLESEPPKP